MFNKLSLDDLDFAGRRVLVRVDFNVPLDEHGQVREFTRIKASLPTIHNIIDYDSPVILMSHFGRPDGKRVEKYSLKPIVPELERLLGKDIQFARDCIGSEVEAMTRELKPGEVLLLENVRFHPGEKTNDPEYAKELAKMGDVYVNDAFGAAHRKQASIHAITDNFLGCAAAGRLMMREIRFLHRALSEPERPFIGIVGGAKISSKIETIQRLLPRVDKLLIGGGMAYTIIKAKGEEIGDSLFEADKLDVAKDILENHDANKVVLPMDSMTVSNLDYGSETVIHPSGKIPEGWQGLDIGPKARVKYVEVIKHAKTVLWNGPMGLFEREPFASGTRAVARAMINISSRGKVAVVGGGDTMAALHKFQLSGAMTHISTGGGSLLEFMEGKEMPGIEALTDREKL